MNAEVRRVLGESLIDDVLEYRKRIRPQMDEAKAKAVANAVNDAQRDAIRNGHGHYIGSCSHTIEQCRCATNPRFPHPVIEVSAPCRKCSVA